MFCRECGKMVQDGNKFCIGCGAKIIPISIKNNTHNVVKTNQTSQNTGYSRINNYNNNYKISKDKNSIGFNILAFLVPLVGLILYIIMKDDTPKKAKGIGISALVGYIISFIFAMVYLFFFSWVTYALENVNIEDKIKDKIEYFEEYDYKDEEFDRNYNKFNKEYEFNGNYNI